MISAEAWGRLHRAVEHYRTEGFEYLEMPWHASFDVCSVTCPNPDRMFPILDGVLVGSAEQSFMQAQFDDRLAPGKYVALTPCFRHEPRIDATHQSYFMKVELYHCGATNPADAFNLMMVAQSFMSRETDKVVECVITNKGWDLEIGGIEVGSYNYIEHGERRWACGTGVAEPRFGYAMSRDEAPKRVTRVTREMAEA